MLVCGFGRREGEGEGEGKGGTYAEAPGAELRKGHPGQPGYDQ